MYITINATHYWVEQHGHGPPILLLHGFTGTHHTWDNFVNDWNDQLTIITMDLPGHGKTDGNTHFTMESVCKDIDHLLQELGMERLDVLGYSMGGRTALSFAMNYPRRVERLILESASPGLETAREQLTRQTKDESLAAEIERYGVKAFINRWQELPMFSSQQTLSAEVKQVIREERLSHTAEGLAASLRGMGTGIQPSWWDNLSTFSGEVLLLSGELDEKFTSIAQNMEKAFQKARHIKVLNAGHAIHVEQPKFFGKIVTEFIFPSEE
ncbi:2-succinyl-6-hydroxy-2,4-cyclohexadiene-1-carboxylate synthase [Pontibacillus yanchengensis]|uniref:Putative 2-succinyl-6-hydroxy-2,4-cyclohexadiene-1-carboxylate synthase n=1 Tax=Pontibacillus yanchengensis TaxID=462910 RepID=A0A6I4ZXF4_9BACI|nr:2-succinyl-6-hydroxy-2,4-cyclohexadiene-1-carboxylate synthase [Pontibacillus yanchengensis]MYL33794.1 2-succinyl-6-hydroxy-2,4-cyclohexadiene-1-carboxylate synthase [Pontibacillus yanchengensis]